MRIAFHASLQVSPLVGNCRDVARVQAIENFWSGGLRTLVMWLEVEMLRAESMTVVLQVLMQGIFAGVNHL